MSGLDFFYDRWCAFAEGLARGFLKRWGSSACKRRVWDEEYSKGLWVRARGQAAVAFGRRDSVLEIIEKYSAGGGVLELGCGCGETALEMANVYREYLGVDISDVAIRRGVEAASQCPSRVRKITLVVGDICTYLPDTTFSVILFRESIYYVPKPKIPGTLRRLGPFLAPGGVFIVRVHDRAKHSGILEMIERDYQVVERVLPGNGSTATFVFRPVCR